MFFFFGCANDGFNTALEKESGVFPPDPGNSGTISATYTNATLLDVRWQSASDDTTPQNMLQYRLFASNAVFSSYDQALAQADELTNGWAVGILSLQVPVPLGSSYNWCNVYVRDAGGNISAYNGTVPVYYSIYPPTTGNGGALALTRNRDSLNIQWQAATSSSTVSYRVYYSSSNNILSFDQAENQHNGIEITNGWTAPPPVSSVFAITSSSPLTFAINANALARNTTWYFNVFAMGADGGISAYTTSSINLPANVAPVPDNSNTTVTLNANFTATLGWNQASDDYTPPEQLQYRIFYSTSSIAWDGTNLPSTGEITYGWTTNITTALTPVLNRSTTYNFRVFVCDMDGAINAYNSCSYAVPASVFVPGVIQGLANSAGAGGVPVWKLTWTAASDQVTPTSLLQYRVFSSTSAPALTSSNPPPPGTGVVEYTLGWTTNFTSATIPNNGLTPPPYYYVYVCNADGSILVYSPYAYTSGSAPTPGNSGSITATSLGSKMIQLSWTKATDVVTPQIQLQYCVYSSKGNDATAQARILTYSAAVDATTPTSPNYSSLVKQEQTWTADINTVTCTMQSAAYYYFNVFVKNGAGVVSAYNPVTQKAIQ